MWLSTINAIKEATKDIKKFKKEERISLGNLFETMSNLLIEMINSFEDNKYPHMTCSTIETIGKNIENNMTKVIKKKSKKEILEYFKPFHSVKDDWEKRNQEGYLDELRSAAGEFKGLSILFKT
jgi:hypothetical protein